MGCVTSQKILTAGKFTRLLDVGQALAPTNPAAVCTEFSIVALACRIVAKARIAKVRIAISFMRTNYLLKS